LIFELLICFTFIQTVALPVLFAREQIQTGGFEPAVGHTIHIFNVLFVYLSLLCFKARQSLPRTPLRSSPGHPGGRIVDRSRQVARKDVLNAKNFQPLSFCFPKNLRIPLPKNQT